MLNKTTSTNYLKYGYIAKRFKEDTSLITQDFTVTDENVYQLTSYDSTIYVEIIEGMAMLNITTDIDTEDIEKFVIHRTIAIQPGNWFAIIPMHDYIHCRYYMHPDANLRIYDLPEPIKYCHIVPTIRLDEIISYYYVVKRPGYQFPGEVHHYYELTYVDRGSLHTKVDDNNYDIERNQCILYGPGQFHDQKIVSEESCSYLTVIFQATGIPDQFVLNKVFTCNRAMAAMIEAFVKSTDSEGDYKYDAMVNALLSIIISMLPNEKKTTNAKPTSPINQHFEDRLVEEIIEYINKHLFEPLPIEQICDRFSISRSTLQNLFKNNLNIPPKLYINNAKLSRSRTLIRQGDKTISEISSMLGFNSIHYFSRKFTAYYGVTPSEYARKIYHLDDEKEEHS